MDRTTSGQPENYPQPPPYSEVAPQQRSIPAATISQMHAAYVPHPDHHRNPTMAFVPGATITQQPGTTVHIVTAYPLGPDPTVIICNTCRQRVTSKITQERSIRAHLCAISLCLLGCWPCVPFIYCMDCCMNVNHRCSSCNAYQGTFIAT